MVERSTAPFARDATGLVREVGAWPSFLATFGLVTGGVPLLLINTLYTAPGANWTLALTIAFLPSLSLAVLAVIMAISMPRSGADYVFTSRALHPFLGFVSYFGLVSAFTLNYGIFAFLGATYVGYLTASLGVVGNNTSLISIGSTLGEPVYSFTIAAITILVTGMIGLLRPKYAWKFVLWAGIIALGATAIFFIAMATINPGTFQSAYNAMVTSGNFTFRASNSTALATYGSVLSTGGLPSSGLMAATFAALPFAWFSYTWYTLPASWSGEMKNVRRSMFIAIAGAVAWIFVYYTLFQGLVFHAFGQDFLEAWSNLNAAGTPPLTGVGNFVPFFVYLVYPSSILLFIMFIALFLPNLFSLPVIVISQTRYVFSWSFDRILPDRLASVNERLHTPLIASLIIIIGGLVGAFILDFVPEANISVTTFPMFTFGYIIPALAGVALPFFRKDLYESAVIVKRRILGVPAIAWLGAITAVYLIFSTYLAINVGNLPLNLTSGLTYLVIYGLGVVIYAFSYYHNKRRGIPVDLIFKQIPPE